MLGVFAFVFLVLAGVVGYAIKTGDFETMWGAVGVVFVIGVLVFVLASADDGDYL